LGPVRKAGPPWELETAVFVDAVDDFVKAAVSPAAVDETAMAINMAIINIETAKTKLKRFKLKSPMAPTPTPDMSSYFGLDIIPCLEGS
jgi:hypothetical protein